MALVSSNFTVIPELSESTQTSVRITAKFDGGRCGC